MAEKLGKVKAGVKGVITQSCRNLEEFIAEASQTDIEAKIATISRSLDRINKLNDDLYDILEIDVVEDLVVKDGRYNEEVDRYLAQLKAAIVKNKPNEQTKSVRGFQLPKLSLPIFRGDPTQWVGFWDIFSCSVDGNKDLSDIQKLTYLRGQLVGEASKLIAGFKLEAKNYAPAVALLKDNYGQVDRIKYALVTNLCQINPPSYNISELKQFYASFESIFKSIESHNMTKDEICAVMLLNKLPSPLKENIKRDLQDDLLDLTAILTKLQTEMFSLEGSTMNRVEYVEPSTLSTLAVKHHSTTNKFQCTLCQGYNHTWFKCRKYPRGHQRVKRAKQLNLCVGCLDKQHGAKGCTNPKVKPCKFCGNKHYHSLCTETTKVRESEDIQTCAVVSAKRKGLLPTVRLPVVGKNKKVVKVRTLLDQCSQKSFVLRSALPSLQWHKVGQETMSLEGFLDVKDSKQYDIASLNFIRKGRKCQLEAVIVDKIPGHQAPLGLQKDINKFQSAGLKLADPTLTTEKDIQILIGVDYYYEIVHPGYRREGTVILIPTICGYALSGVHRDKTNDNTQIEVVSILKLAVGPIEEYFSTHDPCTQDLDRLWELDHIGIMSNELKTDIKNTMQAFDESITYDSEKRQYKVGLPWRENKDRLPSNFGLALGRLRHLQKTFQQKPEFAEQYSNVIKDQEKRGFIERIPKGTLVEGGHYLPHHGIKKDSVTTPIRIVYDCSAKTSANSLSLNDCLQTGPSLVPDLAQVLLRFRCGKYAFVADIEKAFLMVLLKDEDKDFTRFLWPINLMDLDSGYHIYRFNVVLFGATCSQFLLNATIRHHLSLIGGQENDRVIRNLYIDNLQGMAENEKELIEHYWEVQKIFNTAHLYLREFVTNSPQLQGQLEVDGVNANEKDAVKVLGLMWNTSKDTLSFLLRDSPQGRTTKRTCLSRMSQLFDPLGFLVPVSIKSRIFLQNLWKLKIDWDQTLPEEMVQEWKELTDELHTVSEITIPRLIGLVQEGDMHVFSDASRVAYGTCIYVVRSTQSNLVMSKAKVAPIKAVTIPKLELTAVLLAARLCTFVKEAYQNVIQFRNIVLWCDSQVALHWLNSSKSLPTYVANRVEEIRNLISIEQIRYVTTIDNPADQVTRGITAEQLKESSLWWHGPQWLPHHEKWPQDLKFSTIEDCSDQDQITVVTNISLQPKETLEWERYGSYDKCLRVLAWVLRFVYNLYAKITGSAITTNLQLSVKELRASELKLTKLVQQEGYPQEYRILTGDNVKTSYTNLMLQLGLHMDHGVIKCRGRIQLATLQDSTKFPTLLPGNHHVTHLLIQRQHALNHHFGTNYTVAHLRQKWWIPKMRQVVKKILRVCKICKRLQGKPYSPVDSPPLPPCRITQSEPFQVTGVDYTGALKVKYPSKEVGKAYVVLFTCATTRGIHLEIVEDLTGQSFIFALRRFVGRQGFPQVLLSDNATTFTHAAKYVMNDPQVTEHLQINKCEWRFIPARAPWFGAIWERLIGTMKAALRKVLGRALVTVEELSTILVEIEASMNDRPLTYVTTELDDINAITPSLLIRGRNLKAFHKPCSVEDVTDPTFATRQHLMERVEYITQLSSHLWKRWKHEYLVALRESHTCLLRGNPDLWPRVGDVVLIHDDGPRSLWKLGKITGLHGGRDGLVRVASLKTSLGATTRPIVKLYPLEQDLSEPVSAATNVDPPGTACNQRPPRRAALGSASLWRSKLALGLI